MCVCVYICADRFLRLDASRDRGAFFIAEQCYTSFLRLTYIVRYVYVRCFSITENKLLELLAFILLEFIVFRLEDMIC